MKRRRPFRDRRAGGARLAAELSRRGWRDPLVLGLARGGVVVAGVVADILGAPLDVSVARKIGAPGHPEFGVGAVTSAGDPTYDQKSLRSLGLTEEDLEGVCAAEQEEARRREQAYLRGRAALRRAGRDVILVDDGLATGVTARAAARALRQDRPRSLVFAAPVGAPEAAIGLKAEVDDVVCVLRPERFRAVGEWYRDFGQTTDEEVIEVLGR